MREQSRRADPVGQGAHVIASLPFGQGKRLERIKHVSHEKRNRHARQDASVHQRGRKPEHTHAQWREDEQLHQVIDERGHETLAVARRDEFHFAARSFLASAARQPT